MCLRGSSGGALSSYTPEPLPLTVGHHPLEPATSLISRLAARYGPASSTDFCRDIAFPYKALLRGDLEAIEDLARLAGCDAMRMRWGGPRSAISGGMPCVCATRWRRAHAASLAHPRLPGLHPAGCWVCGGSLARAPTGSMAVCFDPVLSGA